MRITLLHDQPRDNCILWEFEGFIGVVDYLPYMNDSIQQAMIDDEADYYVILNMGWSLSFPSRSFKMIARPLIGAPQNLRKIIIAASNPLAQGLLRLTLGREPALQQRLSIGASYDEAVTLLDA